MADFSAANIHLAVAVPWEFSGGTEPFAGVIYTTIGTSHLYDRSRA